MVNSCKNYSDWLSTVLFRIVFLMLDFKCQTRSPVAISGPDCGFKLIRYQNLIMTPNHFGRIKFVYLYQNTVLSSYSPVPKKQIRIWANGIRTMKTRKLSRSAPWKCSWSNSRRRYHLKSFKCLVFKVRLTSEYTECTGTWWWTACRIIKKQAHLRDWLTIF